MNFIYSRWYTILLRVTDVILLSILWAIVSTPLITLYPATIALMETINHWDDDGTTYVQGSHAWHVFPAIQQFKIDVNTGEALSEPIILWNGTGGLVGGYLDLFIREKASMPLRLHLSHALLLPSLYRACNLLPHPHQASSGDP